MGLYSIVHHQSSQTRRGTCIRKRMSGGREREREKNPWGVEKTELTGQNEKRKTDQGRIAEVEDIPGPPAQTDLADPILEGGEKDVEGRSTGGEEGTPMPMVILGAE